MLGQTEYPRESTDEGLTESMGYEIGPTIAVTQIREQGGSTLLINLPRKYVRALKNIEQGEKWGFYAGPKDYSTQFVMLRLGDDGLPIHEDFEAGEFIDTSPVRMQGAKSRVITIPKTVRDWKEAFHDRDILEFRNGDGDPNVLIVKHTGLKIEESMYPGQGRR